MAVLQSCNSNRIINFFEDSGMDKCENHPNATFESFSNRQFKIVTFTETN